MGLWKRRENNLGRDLIIAASIAAVGALLYAGIKNRDKIKDELKLLTTSKKTPVKKASKTVLKNKKVAKKKVVLEPKMAVKPRLAIAKPRKTLEQKIKVNKTPQTLPKNSPIVQAVEKEILAENPLIFPSEMPEDNIQQDHLEATKLMQEAEGKQMAEQAYLLSEALDKLRDAREKVNNDTDKELAQKISDDYEKLARMLQGSI